MAAKGQGVDEGSSAVKVVEVAKKGGALLPVSAAAVAAEWDRDAPSWNGEELRGHLRQAGIKPSGVVAGLSGKDLVVRYHQVPEVPDWQLRQIMEFEVAEIEKQSGDSLASDFNLLPVASDLSSDDTVLLALTREQGIEERNERLGTSGLKPRYYTPNAVALYHAYRLYGPAADGDVLIANIGKSGSDLVVVREGDLLYARSAGTGGDVLTEALVKEFNVSPAKAEKLKCEMGDLRRASERKGLSPQQEKVSYALESAAGRLYQLVQSTLQFAKSQLQLNQLEPSLVLLTGGSARMKGLDQYLEGNLGVPVKLFDPLADADVEVDGNADTLAMTAALGLAVMAADPEAYSVEVLSRKARKAREFQERHVFSVLALLLVLGYLGFSAYRAKGEYAQARSDHSVLNVERSNRQRKENQFADLKSEQLDLMARVNALERERAGGESLARALRSMSLHMPDELWLESVELENRKEAGRSATLTPQIGVRGRGRSVGDRSADAAFQSFVHDLRSEQSLGVPGRLIESPSTVRDDFAFELRFDYLLPAPPPADADEVEGE